MRRTAAWITFSPHRRVVKLVGGALVGALSVAAAAQAPVRAQAPQSRPNVLLIITDDQRYEGTLRVMPRTRDWFGDGTTFTNAYATTPLCCPSRASVMTGLYAHNHGVRHNYDAGRLDHSITVQRYLHDAGYATALSGKFLNAWPVDEAPPYFDRWAFFQKGGYRGLTFNVDGRTRSVGRYSTGFVREKATEFIEEFESDDQRPWYLYVAPFAPHGPPVPSPNHRSDPVPSWRTTPATTEEDLSDKPPFVRASQVTMTRARQLRRGQLRALMSVDVLVDRLRQTLEELDEDEETLVIFLSDNGELWHDHGMIGKRYAYIPSVQIPMMLRWPGRVDAGELDDRLTATIDLAPTILEGAGVSTDVTAAMDGRSLLQGDTRDLLLVEHWGDPDGDFQEWAAILTKEYEYIEYYEKRRRNEPIFREYYDLDADPWQLRNLLAGEQANPDPDTVALSSMLRAAERCRAMTCP